MRHLAALLALASIVIAGCGSASPLDAESQARLVGAATAHRVIRDNSFGGADVFDRVDVIDALGEATNGFVEFSDDATPLTDAERTAIMDSLAPRQVDFVPIGTPPTNDGSDLVALVSVAVPEGESDKATIVTGLVCGGTCGVGGGQRFTVDEGDPWRFSESVRGQWVS